MRSDRWGSLYLSVFCKRRSGGIRFFLKSNQNPLIPQLQTSHLRHAYTNVYKLYTYIFTSLSLSLFTFDTNWQKIINKISLLRCGLPSKPYNLQLGKTTMKGTCIWLTKLVQSTGIKRDSHGRKFDWLERAVWSENLRSWTFPTLQGLPCLSSACCVSSSAETVVIWAKHWHSRRWNSASFKHIRSFYP